MERELLLSLTDWSNPDDFTYIGLFYTNCMYVKPCPPESKETDILFKPGFLLNVIKALYSRSWEEDVVVCPLMARANHSCRPNAEFVARIDKGNYHWCLPCFWITLFVRVSKKLSEHVHVNWLIF